MVWLVISCTRAQVRDATLRFGHFDSRASSDKLANELKNNSVHCTQFWSECINVTPRQEVNNIVAFGNISHTTYYSPDLQIDALYIAAISTGTVDYIIMTKTSNISDAVTQLH